MFLDGRWFRAVDENGQPVKPEKVAKPDRSPVLMSIREDGRGISFFGNLHPSFAGNVVKAMASARQGYPVVCRLLARQPVLPPTPADLLHTLKHELRAVVHDVVRLTPTIVEVIVEAPMAARAFQPGQFYRLQNYELWPACQRHRPGDGGPRAHWSFGRSRKGLALDHRAGNGWFLRPLRSAEAG